MINFHFHCDKDSDVPYFFKHGVTKQEIYQFFHEIDYFSKERNDNSLMAIGKLKSGRYLKVIYRIITQSDYFIITAFDIYDEIEKNFIESSIGD